MHNIDKKTCRWADSCTTIGLLLTLLFGASSCDSDEIFTQPNGSETTSLTINIGAPTIDITTRGVSDDPDNANGTWTDWELLVDGSRLYRATLMLVDNTNKLVGYADFNEEIKTTRPTEVTATFNELTPNATYKLYAIANYSAIDSWGGLTSMPNLASLTVGSDITSTITALNNYTLPNTGTDYIAAKQPQPLSLVQDITMPAYGSKSVSAELLRTYARLRIEIENRSETDDLKVKSLTFGSSTSNFGYRTTPLMKVEDSQIPNANGRLDYDATDAIIPFAYNESNPLTIAKLNNNGTSNSSAVAFDAYIYENKNNNGFEYNLSLEYGNSQVVEEITYHKGSQTNTPTGGDDNLYMIAYRVRTGGGGGGGNRPGQGQQENYTYYYLTANNNGVGTTTNTNTVFDNQAETVFWEIVNISGNTYTIRSVSQDKYLNIETNSVGLADNTDNLTINNNNIYQQIRRNNNNYRTYYIRYNNGLTSTDDNDNATDFYFYPITKKVTETTISEGVSKDCRIPLNTIINGVSNPTNIIRRNDFINVLVTVSYNKNSGSINFHVSDWNTGKGGDVTFD